MTKRILLAACIALAACSRQENPAPDSNVPLPAVDTLKPATDSLALSDSVNARMAGSTTGAKTKTAGTKTGTKRDSIVGRDSVIPFDPTKKSLPPAKRP